MTAPRRLVALIVAITVAPLAVLFWLGWQLFEQDRLLAERQAHDRLEYLTDALVATLQRTVAAAEAQLRAGRDEWPEGAVALTLDASGVRPSAPERLAYLPVPARLREVPQHVFAPSAELEFRQANLDAATAAYRRLAGSGDAAVQAGALVRLARTLERKGRTDEALAALARLAQTARISELGFDLGLAAIHERCNLLERHGRKPELLREARRLDEELTATRPGLTAAVYALFAADVTRWLGGPSAPQQERETLARAAEVLWEEWSGGAVRRSEASRRTLLVNGVRLAVFWQPMPGAARVLLATPAFVRSEWLTPARRMAEEQQASLTLRSPDGVTVDESETRSDVREPGRPSLIAGRSHAQAELPWAVSVSARQPSADPSFSLRWRLLLSGFVLLAALASAAAFLVLRAVGRELAVARVQSDFVAAVSHEFRTPLTALRQFTDRLREQPKLDADERLLCYEAQSRATDRLTRLVDSVLDFGRLEAGAHPFHFERCNVTELAHAVVTDFCHSQATASAIVFSGSGAWAVLADGEALSRALWNLLDNAVKYSPGGPQVGVEVRVNGAEVVLSVRDRGLGIHPHERRTIFAKFQRGEEARRQGIKGTGLGLAMVSAIVRAHGGRIDVESVPGEGSMFAIVLPLAAAPAGERQGDGTQPESSDGPSRVTVLRST